MEARSLDEAKAALFWTMNEIRSAASSMGMQIIGAVVRGGRAETEQRHA